MLIQIGAENWCVELNNSLKKKIRHQNKPDEVGLKFSLLTGCCLSEANQRKAE